MSVSRLDVLSAAAGEVVQNDESSQDPTFLMHLDAAETRSLNSTACV
jgi:hypothetical protein